MTPFGRYCFNKLPFGISSAPELYQKCMNQVLEGFPGVLYLIDDTLIYGKDQSEHDARLLAALRWLKEAGVTLNTNKCAFRQKSVKFLGHMIDEHGIRADPDKTAAIRLGRVENAQTPHSDRSGRSEDLSQCVTTSCCSTVGLSCPNGCRRRVHVGHQGIERCLQRAKASVWWPGITAQLTQKIENCHTCREKARARKEPLITTSLPDYPWQKVGTDLFELDGVHYLLTVEFLSLSRGEQAGNYNFKCVIQCLKAVFSRHGIPEMWKNFVFCGYYSFLYVHYILVCHHVVKHLSATCLLVHTT